MTYVNYKISEDAFTIKCEGHSGYGTIGNDIVCAGISTLMQTLIAHTDCSAHVSNGYALAFGNGVDAIRCAEMTVTGLKLIESEFPQYLMVEEGCPIINNFNDT